MGRHFPYLVQKKRTALSLLHQSRARCRGICIGPFDMAKEGVFQHGAVKACHVHADEVSTGSGQSMGGARHKLFADTTFPGDEQGIA